MRKTSNLILTCLTFACGTSEADSGLPGALVFAETAYEIGADGSSVELGQPAALAISESGQLWVLDAFDQKVYEFGSDGGFVRTLVGRGEGPGEAIGGAGLALGPVSELVVWDPRLGRISVLDRDSGEVIRLVSRPGTGSVYPWPGTMTDDGDVIEWTVHYDSADALVAQSWRLGTGDDFVRELSVTMRHLRRPGGEFVPFGRRTMVGADRVGEIWHLNPATYEITRMSPDSMALPTPTWASPLPIGRLQLDSVANVRDSLGLPPVDEGLIPTTREIVDRMISDGRNLFFFVADTHSPLGNAVDVISKNGRLIRRIILPGTPMRMALARPVANGEWIAYVEEGTLGNQVVKVVRDPGPDAD